MLFLSTIISLVCVLSVQASESDSKEWRATTSAFRDSLEQQAADLAQEGDSLWAAGDIEGGLARLRKSVRLSDLAPIEGLASESNRLGGLVERLYDLGRYSEALALCRQRVNTLASAGRREDLQRAYFGLARAYYRRGDYAAALDSYRSCLDLVVETYGSKPSKYYPYIHNGIGVVLDEIGDFGGARKAYESAMKAAQGVLEPEDRLIGNIRNNLGVLYRQLGDYDTARRQFQESLRILEAGDPSPEYRAGAIQNLATLERDAGDLETAIRLQRQALAILARSSGPRHSLTGSSHSILATMFSAAGEVDSALVHHETAVGVKEGVEGRPLPDIGHTLEAYAATLGRLGLFEKALTTIQRSIDVSTEVVGSDALRVADARRLKAILSLRAGSDRSEIMAEALLAESVGAAALENTMTALSESRAFDFAKRRPRGLDLALSIAPKLPEDDLLMVWDSVVGSRGMVMRELSRRRRLISIATTDGAAVEAWNEYRDANTAFSAELVQSAGDEFGWDTTALDEAEERRIRAERKLAEASNSFGEALERKRVSASDLLQRVRPNEALVAIVRFDDWENEDELHGDADPIDSFTPSYGAFVGTRDGTDTLVRFLRLGSASELEATMGRWLSDVRSPHSPVDSSTTSGLEVAAAIWEPIEALVEMKSRVYWVPDGLVHELPLYALPTRQGNYLVEAAMELVVLDGERDLLTPRVSGGRGAVVVGGVDFEALPNVSDLSDAAAALDRSSDIPGAPGSGQPESPSSRSPSALPCPGLADYSFEDLPGSRDEMTAVEQRLSAAWPDTADILTLSGADATESKFRQYTVGRRILHLATHGFSIGVDCDGALPGRRGLGALVAEGRPKIRHRLSGLAMATANHCWSSPGITDGLLTEYEVLNLDLTSVEWAVLSACDTARGNIIHEEGVLSLRRAFTLAGAATVITSLWSVDDEVTQIWMDELYRARFEDSATTAQAVRSAHLRALRHCRETMATDHPYLWAPFVAVGDWR